MQYQQLLMLSGNSSLLQADLTELDGKGTECPL